jgi:AGZA family xanthine/uracil permease-like MFS transporter
MEEAIPAFLTIVMMPFAYSISDGIAFGFISYIIMKLVKGKAKEISIPMWIISALFLVLYVVG